MQNLLAACVFLEQHNTVTQVPRKMAQCNWS